MNNNLFYFDLGIEILEGMDTNGGGNGRVGKSDDYRESVGDEGS